jgi:hypothetical protein
MRENGPYGLAGSKLPWQHSAHLTAGHIAAPGSRSAVHPGAHIRSFAMAPHYWPAVG